MARMIIGMTTSGVFLVSYVLAMEMVGPKHRMTAGTLCVFYYTAGFFAMCLVAYFLNNNWQLLQVGLKDTFCKNYIKLSSYKTQSCIVSINEKNYNFTQATHVAL